MTPLSPGGMEGGRTRIVPEGALVAGIYKARKRGEKNETENRSGDIQKGAGNPEKGFGAEGWQKESSESAGVQQMGGTEIVWD